MESLILGAVGGGLILGREDYSSLHIPMLLSRPATSDDHVNFTGQVLSNFQLLDAVWEALGVPIRFTQFLSICCCCWRSYNTFLVFRG